MISREDMFETPVQLFMHIDRRKTSIVFIKLSFIKITTYIKSIYERDNKLNIQKETKFLNYFKN